MSALDDFAEGLASDLASIEDEFKGLNKRRQNLKLRGAVVASGWANHFRALETTMSQAEDALNRISNAPPVASNVTEKKSAVETIPPKISNETIPPKVELGLTENKINAPHVSAMNGAISAGRSNPV